MLFKSLSDMNLISATASWSLRTNEAPIRTVLDDTMLVRMTGCVQILSLNLNLDGRENGPVVSECHE